MTLNNGCPAFPVFADVRPDIDKEWCGMTREEIDILWSKALVDAVRDGEQYTRYHFAAMVTEAADASRLQAQQELAECRAACLRAEHEAQRARGRS